MQEHDWERINQVFGEAVDLDPEARSNYLDEACGSNSEQRRILDQMLAADAEPPALLEAEPGELATLLPEGHDGIPSQVGPYRVDGLVGRGGMGIVVLAERADLPRKVALKLLRDRFLGPDTVRRFKREQRVLASLQHPNIAQLLDAGTSEDGIPFLAMEYIDGTTLTEYVEADSRSIRERLMLFTDVCEAVQFAHQTLVVHRDLKPSNILVDKTGQIKLLDFGISKLLENDEDEILTQTAQRMLTPSYASPEQIRGEMVSTSTDVYSLGVVLYELLVGRRPYDVDGKSATEASRIVTEEMPTRPSSVAELPSIQRRLRGDLDNIVLKALQKDVAQRYVSVEAFVSDIRRHLDGHPVEAYQAGVPYRMRKFASRHRWGVGVGSGVLALLIGFSIAISVQQAETVRERDRAEQEAVRAERTVEFLMGLFQANDPSVALGDSVTARELLQRGVEQAELLSDQPLLQAETYDVVGQVYRSLGESVRSVELLEKAVEIRRVNLKATDPEISASLRHLSGALVDLRRVDEAEKVALEALDLDRTNFVSPDASIARSLNALALVVEAAGDYSGADSLFRLAHEQMQRTLGADNSEAMSVQANRVSVLMRLGNYEQAEILGREVVDWSRLNLPANHPRMADAVDHLAVSLRNQSKFEEAKPFYEETIAIKKSVYGDNHPSTASSLMNLGIFYGIQGDYKSAEPYFKEAVAIHKEVFGPDSPRTANTMISYAVLVSRMGLRVEAVEIYRSALAIQEKALGTDHPDVSASLYNLGMELAENRQYGEAIPLLERTTKIYREVLGEQHHRYIEALSVLGMYETYAGFHEKGKMKARRAVELALLHLGPDNPRTAIRISALGRALVASGDYEEADSTLSRALSLFYVHAEPNHPSAIAMTDALGRAKMHLGAFTESDSLLRVAFEVRLNRLGEEHPWTADTERHLVELYGKWGKPVPDDWTKQVTGE